MQKLHDDVRLRALTSSDAPAIAAMAVRCSTGTLRRRLPGGLREVPRFLVAPLRNHLPADRRDVAALAGNRLVGIASLVRTGALQWEAAMLVEDQYQHRGVGRQLARALVQHAADLGAAEVFVQYELCNACVERLIRRYSSDLVPAIACDGTVQRLVTPRENLTHQHGEAVESNVRRGVPRLQIVNAGN